MLKQQAMFNQQHRFSKCTATSHTLNMSDLNLKAIKEEDKHKVSHYSNASIAIPKNRQLKIVEVATSPSRKNDTIEHSQSNSEVCMQEIVSPFRQLQSSIASSPQRQPDGWTINPVQVPRINLQKDTSTFGLPILHESDSEAVVSSVFEEDTNHSICVSPVKNPAFFKSHDEETVLSPGVLKEFIRCKQAIILQQIQCTK